MSSNPAAEIPVDFQACESSLAPCSVLSLQGQPHLVSFGLGLCSSALGACLPFGPAWQHFRWYKILTPLLAYHAAHQCPSAQTGGSAALSQRPHLSLSAAEMVGWMHRSHLIASKPWSNHTLGHISELPGYSIFQIPKGWCLFA